MSKISIHAINITRMLLILLSLLASISISLGTQSSEYPLPMWLGIFSALLFSFFIIYIETLLKDFSLKNFSSATFGLMIGLFCAWLLTKVQVHNLLIEGFLLHLEKKQTAILIVNTILYTSFSFLGVALALRTSQEDFAFVIPYVRFNKNSSWGQPIILDHEALKDGRISGLLKSGFLRGRVIIPLFILKKLQTLASSTDDPSSLEAKKALEHVESLQEDPLIDVSIHDSTLAEPEERIDLKLIETAQMLGARLLTINSSLTKSGRIQGATVLNINDLVEALKPSLSVGQQLRLPLVRPGKEDHQAIGYLPDGSMIVVNQAISKVGTSQDVRIISSIQTSAGQMIFAELIQ